MRSSSMTPCPSCGNSFNSNHFEKCPVCKTEETQLALPSLAQLAQERSRNRVPKLDHTSSNIEIDKSYSTQVPPAMSMQKQSYGRLAAASAKTVERYGRVMQVIAVISGIILFAAFCYIARLDDYPVRTIFIGFLFSVLFGWVYFVFGAIFRMITNYILFRTAE
jgi:hypothetical protein